MPSIFSITSSIRDISIRSTILFNARYVLNQFHEGIIALSACLAGEVQRYIMKGLYHEAKKCAQKYENCFGKGNFFLELQDHGIPEQQQVNTELLRMSRELQIPLVATNDVH